MQACLKVVCCQVPQVRIFMPAEGAVNLEAEQESWVSSRSDVDRRTGRVDSRTPRAPGPSWHRTFVSAEHAGKHHTTAPASIRPPFSNWLLLRRRDAVSGIWR